MAKIIKLTRKYWRRLKKHPWAKWVLLGAGGAAILAVAAVVLLGGRSEVTGFGENTTTISLVAGGDLNVTDNTVASGKTGSGYDYTRPFLDVAEIFAGADGALLNFEGNFYGEPYGSATVSAPLAMAQTLKAMGVDFLQVANSCTVKNGMLGLKQTLNSIRQTGMEPLGAYESNSDAARQQGFVLRDIGGVRVALVAFTKGMDGMGLPAGSEKCVNLLYTDYTSTYQKIDTEGISRVLEAVEKAKPDNTIALLHWGSEGNNSISPSQKKIVKQMLSLGVDAIIGTHSHQVQSVVYDEENHTLVAYSLGDFYGSGEKNGTYYSVLLNLQVTKDNLTGETKITSCSHTPIYLLTPERDGEPLRLMRMEAAIESYEGNHVDKITEIAYNNMLYALKRANSRVETGK